MDNPMNDKFKAKQALSCAICGVIYQLADNTEIFRAATASEGNSVFPTLAPIRSLPVQQSQLQSY
jgi:hypothetical protein